MHALTTEEQIQKDCQILLERAFLGKQICAFGEDGCGEHGRNPQAFWYSVDRVEAGVICDDVDAPAIIQGYVRLGLEGYVADADGIIATDRNFDIRARELLEDAGIDGSCLKWPPDVSLQGNTFVLLDVEVGKLLEWV